MQYRYKRLASTVCGTVQSNRIVVVLVYKYLVTDLALSVIQSVLSPPICLLI